MKLLILGSTTSTRDILKQLIGTSRHKLEWHSGDEDSYMELRGYDMVLVDGSLADCVASARLLDKVQRIRNRSPQIPILVLSPMDGAAHHAVGHSCGITRSADGVSQMRCRLKELAWNETAALLRDALDRPLREPITFEYQG